MACVRRFLAQSQSNPCVAMSDSGKYKSITQRYPGIKGKLLRDKVDSDYVSETNRTLRFLDSNGKQLLRAHDLNERNQRVVIEEYVAGILEHGLIADVRSKPICIPSESQYDHAQNEGTFESFMLVGHWQLCSAIYEAHRREPHNKQVMATIRDGLKGALVLKKHTPEDVIIYYRDQANMFHKGSGISFVQLLRDVTMQRQLGKITGPSTISQWHRAGAQVRLRTNRSIGNSSRQPSQISGHTGSALIRARQRGTSWIVFSALNHCTS